MVMLSVGLAVTVQLDGVSPGWRPETPRLRFWEPASGWGAGVPADGRRLRAGEALLPGVTSSAEAALCGYIQGDAVHAGGG